MHPKSKWYYFVLALPFYMVAILPMPVLYGISNLLYVLVYKLFGYRVKVVRENLKKAFPNKLPQELLHIEKKFYVGLFDVMIETLAALMLSDKAIAKNVVMQNIELIEQYHRQQSSVILLLGHLGNWEWGGFSFAHQLNYQAATLYHPLSNPFFEWLTFNIRNRKNLQLIPMQQVLRDFTQHKNVTRTVAFIADQSPAPEQALWVPFLHQDTGFFTGAEKIAQKFNHVVVYVDVVRIKRGNYKVSFKLITDKAPQHQFGEITRLFAAHLENSIKQTPHLWLWSHRRWKHKRP